MVKTKKIWLLISGLMIFTISGLLITTTKAQINCGGGGKTPLEFYRVNPGSSILSEGVANAESCLMNVFNRSNVPYFVPNKTPGEFESFKTNPPNYNIVSVCGDGVCGEGENKNNCGGIGLDCYSYDNEDYCGDGHCNGRTECHNEEITVTAPEVCEYNILGAVFWPIRLGWLIVTGDDWAASCTPGATSITVNKICEYVGPESWETCPDDCTKKDTSGCGVCGYDGAGNLCPNYCNNRALDMFNCVWNSGETSSFDHLAYINKSFANYFKIKEVFAIAALPKNDTNPSYRSNPGWSCNNQTKIPCPEGKYCTPGGLYSDTWHTCPAGHFCLAGSYYPRKCPPNTYSSAGAFFCSVCPAGTNSMPGSTSVNDCAEVFIYDGSCRSRENPTNSPDCPDEFSQSPYTYTTNPKFSSSNNNHTRQSSFYNDGLCTGIENISPSSHFYSPNDCFCGNGECDNGESVHSCYIDCSCGNDFCDSVNSLNRPIEAQGVDENSLNCSDDCYCGDGVCDTNESNLTCPSDCHCGVDANNDGNKCDSMPPYSENRNNCPGDCFCGNGKCEPSKGETFGNCSSDCLCGDGYCSVAIGERRSTCSDCTSSDGICDPDEVFGQPYYSATDCHCGNGVCQTSSPYYESESNCSQDCFSGHGPIIKPPITPPFLPSN